MSHTVELKDKNELPTVERQHQDTDLKVPPDGGFGWVQVLVAHLELFNTFGYSYSYGIFEQHYNQEMGYSLSSSSWIGSVYIFLLFALSAASGRLFDAGYFRHLLIVGSLLQVVGMFMASISTQYWQILLSQGICGGIGAGLAYCPVMACVSTYFSKKRALAISIVTSGSATGGIIFPIIAQQMMGQYGFPWTMRCISFVILFNAVIVVVLAKEFLPPRKMGPMIELAAFKEVPYSLFTVGVFLLIWSVFIGSNYINHYGSSLLGISHETSLNILLTLNAFGCPGRIIPSLVSDAYLGPFSTLVPLVMSASILYFGWIGIKSVTSLFVFAALFGFSCGGIQSVGMAGLPVLTKDHSKMGTRMGMILTISSLAALTGPPLAGALIDAHGGGYLYMQVWGGCTMAAAAALVVGAQQTQKRVDSRADGRSY